MTPLKKPIALWIVLPTVLLAFGLGVSVDRLMIAQETPDITVCPGELRQSSGKLTNPLLECEVFSEQGLKTLRPFKFKIEELLREKIAAGVITEGSVYFRDLNNGLWFGINEEVKYHPASLLKVPIMIACFKLAEKDPALLKKKIRYQGNFDMVRWQGIEPSSGLVQGESYAVEDLIVRMISLSDNNAAQLIINTINTDAMNRVLQDLDVNVNPEDPEHYITMHGYSGFFRVLYNASYLNREYSERALEILARSEFIVGLRAGLPPGQLAATKFGESGVAQDPEIVQLHEVGIIYYPGRPYLLGVMTRGRRGEDFSGVLRDISRLVYTSVAEKEVPSEPPPAQMFK